MNEEPKTIHEATAELNKELNEAYKRERRHK